jgi:hypothetical protein
MFCNSDSCDSAICLSEPRSPPVDMEAFYFFYSPFPLFTGVRGRRILGRSLWVKLLLHHRLGRQVVIGSSCQCTTFQMPSSAP